MPYKAICLLIQDEQDVQRALKILRGEENIGEQTLQLFYDPFAGLGFVFLFYDFLLAFVTLFLVLYYYSPLLFGVVVISSLFGGLNGISDHEISL